MALRRIANDLETLTSLRDIGLDQRRPGEVAARRLRAQASARNAVKNGVGLRRGGRALGGDARYLILQRK